MDQVRNFTQANRSSIVNIIYIVAAVVLVYYLVMYYYGGEQRDTVLLKNKLETTQIKEENANQIYPIVKKDEKSMRLGAEYTLSFWIYISNYSAENTNKGILALYDLGNMSGNTLLASLFIGLHPTKPQMIIRAGAIQSKALSDESDFVKFTKSGETLTWNGATVETGDAMSPCDIMDIDLQRWMNVSVSVNGRIMDVYLDGKLARSCIMSNGQTFTNEKQSVVLVPTEKRFNGYISGVQISNYAVTPDAIYARYQAGPYFSSSFLDYLVDKLGIRISYTGSSGTTNVGVFDWLFKSS